jgi:threonine dehydrogenase-like Zn-dependent dehydrogenase
MAVTSLFPEAEVTSLARYPHQQQLAERLGAQHIMQRSSYPEVARLTGGAFFSAPLNRGIVTGGFDVIYDCVADEHTTNDALRWVRAGGTVVMIGSHMSPMPKLDLTLIWYHQVNLMGSYGHGVEEWAGERKHTYELVFEQYQKGNFPVEELITHRFPYRDYKEAIRVATAKGKERAVKVMFQDE